MRNNLWLFGLAIVVLLGFITLTVTQITNQHTFEGGVVICDEAIVINAWQNEKEFSAAVREAEIIYNTKCR